MQTEDDPIICVAPARSVAPLALSRLREDLCLPPASGAGDALDFVWRPGRLLQRISASASAPAGNGNGEGDCVRVTSRIPILRDVTAEPMDVEHLLASLNHFAHRSCYVFDPAARAIDAVQSVVVSRSTFDADAELLRAGCQLQFVHALFHADRLQSRVGGRNADDEWPVEPPLDQPREAAEALRAALVKPAEAASRFADAFEMETIAEQVNAVNAFSAGGSAKGVVIECPFARTTALLGLKTDEEHPAVGRGLIAYVKLPIFGDRQGLARIAAWLNRKELEGVIPGSQGGAWTVRKHDETHLVSHIEFLPNALYRPGVALRLAQDTMRTIRSVNRLFNPGVPERDVVEVLEERTRPAHVSASREDPPATRGTH